jgi:tetratricopeptide (TPR) repeat protein
MKYSTVLGLALCMMVSFTSCKSLSNNNPVTFDKAPLLGMVYDYDNAACAGVTVSINGKPVATSDIDGRFFIPDLDRGEHIIELAKRDYESSTTVIDYESKSQVLYLKILSFDELLVQAQDALEAQKKADAESLLQRAEKVRLGDPEAQYFRALLLYREKRYDDAVEELENLIDNDNRDPYVYLFLADIYQYNLNDIKAAKVALTEFLTRIEDTDIRKRFEALSEQPMPISP